MGNRAHYPGNSNVVVLYGKYISGNPWSYSWARWNVLHLNPKPALYCGVSALNWEVVRDDGETRYVGVASLCLLIGALKKDRLLFLEKRVLHESFFFKYLFSM